MDLDLERAVIERVPKQLLVGSGWRESASEAVHEVEDPATARRLCSVADATPADAVRALDAAVAAAQSWSATPPRERSDLLMSAYQAIRDNSDYLALLITLEMGKPLNDARGEVAYAAEFFRWFAEEATRINGGYMLAPDGRSHIVIRRIPVGPALLVTPWNFPLAMPARKIAPALAAGCTAIVKPAPQTPLSTLALAGILRDTGLPDGVLNILTTTDADRVVSCLLEDSRLRKLSFTGSTATGRHLLRSSASNVLRTSMELGGNAAFIVFSDADIDAAVEGALVAKMRNIGEACTAANRFYVQRNLAAEFAARMSRRMAALAVGRGTEAGVEVGPLIDESAVRKVSGLVADALERGASLETGGRAPERDGYFYEPTLLTGVPETARVQHEEIFGPVAPISVFDDDWEAIDAANKTPYGLVGYLYTENMDRALGACERLELGMIGLNQGMISNPAAPFGGVKQSGLGREGGLEGIYEFLETKYIGVRAPRLIGL